VKLSKHKKPLILALIFCVLWIVNLIYPAFLVKAYFYFANGQTITLERYKIRLPFPQWVLVGKNKLVFVVSTDKNIFAEIAIDYRNVEIGYLLNACDQIQKERKIYKNIAGSEYLCYQTDIGVNLYFISDDNFFFLVASDYQDNETNAILYKALFDSITAIE
jgi:hypothetical protein